jgi:hypothetical protein
LEDSGWQAKRAPRSPVMDFSEKENKKGINKRVNKTVRRLTQVPKIILEMIGEMIALPRTVIVKLDVHDVVSILVCDVDHAYCVVRWRARTIVSGIRGEEGEGDRDKPRYRFLPTIGVEPG